MTLFLVGEVERDGRQVADTGGSWPPLTFRGARQALQLIEGLRQEEVGRIVSGPGVRCLQTVAPLARARGLRVDVDPVLGQIASVQRALGAIAQMQQGPPTVVCMPTSLLFAVVDLLKLLEVRVDLLGDLLWVRKIAGELATDPPGESEATGSGE